MSEHPLIADMRTHVNITDYNGDRNDSCLVGQLATALFGAPAYMGPRAPILLADRYGLPASCLWTIYGLATDCRFRFNLAAAFWMAQRVIDMYQADRDASPTQVTLDVIDEYDGRKGAVSWQTQGAPR